MKHFTKLILILLLSLQTTLFAQVSGDFRSKSSGNWGDYSIWQVYNGTAWVNATSGQIPSGTSESNANSVYIEAAHTVVLTSDQSCKDLHLNTTADVVRINTQSSVLNVWGKMRFYQGTAPGATTPNPVTTSGVLGWISTGSQGAIRFRGTADRIVMVHGQVNANNTNSGWNLDFAFDPGFTGQINDRVRAGNITVSSGTLFVNNPTGELRVGTNGGATDQTPNGQFTIKSGATVTGGAGIFKKSDVAAESITVESGGNLIIDKSFYVLAAVSLNLNGTVTLKNGIKFPTEAGRASAAAVNTFNNLILEGKDTLQNNVTVNGKLSLKGAGALISGSYALSYGPNGELEYLGSSAQTTTNSEFPSSNGPANLTINNSNGVTLHASRSISNQLTLASGLLLLGDNNLTLGANSPAVAGTLSATNMVVTNGSGELNKIFSSAGSYLYPIGDNNSTAEYSPAQITVNSASLFNGTTYFGTRVIDNVHPSAVSTNDNLSRYWEVATNMTGYSYDANLQYLVSDVTGTESNINSILFVDETSNSSRKVLAAVNPAIHQIQFANQNAIGFVGGANFGCNITNNTINTTNSWICFGQSMTIDASAAIVSSGNPVYQWQVSKNEGAWTNILINGNSEDYIHSDTLTAGIYSYRRIVSDPINCISSSNVTSNEISVTVQPLTQVLQQPSNATACTGTNVSFSISAIGTSLIYIWQESTDGGTTFSTISNGGYYSGATTSTLKLVSITSAFNNRLYRCTITGSCSPTVYSNAALLSNPATIIINKPTNKAACQGANTSFSIVVSGSQNSFQWQVSDDNGTTFNNIVDGGVYSNSSTSTLSLTGVTIGMNNYQYRCVVTGPCGVLTSTSAPLTVNPATMISNHPTNASTCAGGGTNFSVAGTGLNLIYKWQVSSNGGASFSYIYDGTNYSGTTTSTLSIINAPSSFNNLQYRCSITGTCGAALTNSAVLTVNGIVINTQPVNKTVCPSATTTFSVDASGSSLSYQWQVSTDGGSNFTNITDGIIYTGSITNTLTVVTSSGMNNYKYRCVVSNSCGSNVISAVRILSVRDAVSIISQSNDINTCVGGDITLNVVASGTETVYYRWKVSTNGGSTYAYINNSTLYSNATTPNLTITDATVSLSNYKYRCDISNVCGSKSSTAITLTVDGGCSAKMAATSVESTIEGYPNPFNDQINLTFKGFNDNVNVVVKDLDGKIVYNKENVPSSDLLVIGNELLNGFYIIEIKNDKNYKSLKVLKMK